MKLYIKKLHEKAQIPVKAVDHEADFCYDCYAVSEEELAPGVWKYHLGFAVQPINEFDGTHSRHSFKASLVDLGDRHGSFMFRRHNR